MFSSHTARYAHATGFERTMALVEMAGGVIVLPIIILGLLFTIAIRFAGV